MIVPCMVAQITPKKTGYSNSSKPQNSCGSSSGVVLRSTACARRSCVLSIDITVDFGIISLAPRNVGYGECAQPARTHVGPGSFR